MAKWDNIENRKEQAAKFFKDIEPRSPCKHVNTYTRTEGNWQEDDLFKRLLTFCKLCGENIETTEWKFDRKAIKPV